MEIVSNSGSWGIVGGDSAMVRLMPPPLSEEKGTGTA
jgi:hypothetical protein